MKKASSKKNVEASPSAPPNQKQVNGATTINSSGDVAHVATPSTHSTTRKTGMAALAADARSLLAPSLTASSYRSPIRPAASPGATSTLSTSPIGRSPSAQSQALEGGAAARLRRVTSNASFASSAKAVATPSTPPGQDEISLAPPETSSPQYDASASSAADYDKGEGSSSLKVPEIGSKRPLPGSQLRPAQPSRSPSRRKTWFGWTGNGEQSDEQTDRASQEEAIRNDESAGESQLPTAVAGPAPAKIDTGQSVDMNSHKTMPAGKLGEVAGGQSSWSMWRIASSEPQATSRQKLSESADTCRSTRSIKDEVENVKEPTSLAAHSDSEEESVATSRPQGESTAVASSPPVHGTASGSRLWALWPGTWVPHVSNEDVKRAGALSRVDTPMVDDQATEVPDSSQKATEQSDQKGVGAPARILPGNSLTQGWASWIPYASQSSGGLPAATSGQSQDQTSMETDSDAPLTPADEVKRSALARPGSSPPTCVATLEPSAAALNSTTRSSWLAYFASRGARPVQSIEPNGPETMDVDFEEMVDASSSSKSLDVKDSQAKQINQAQDLQPPAPVSKTSAASSVNSKATDAPKPDPAPPTSRPATPLTGETGKAEDLVKKSAKQAKKSTPSRPPLPNMVLPSFDDTFHTLPRSVPPPAGVLKRTLSAMNAWLSSSPPDAARLRTAPKLGKNHQKDEAGLALVEQAAVRLPRAWDVVGQKSRSEKRGCQNVNRVVIISCHGWFAQSKFSMLMGSPTGTSQKFALEMRGAVMRHFESVEGMQLNPEAITLIPLSADGTAEVRTDSSFAALLSRKEWVNQLAAADAIFVACHSQGCVVGTNLLARLIEQSYIQTRKTRIALLAMCGIHEGPFQHIQSMLVSSYLTYFETEAAKELFAFQSSTSPVSKRYQASMRLILEAGAKVVLLASTDDQVVPLHSALFTSINHPSILRALYIHGHTFPKLDFLTNLLTFCVRVRNAGLSDHQLLAQLSVAVAGSLYGGAGHSLCYDEPKSYDLAVSYLFETTHPLSEPTTRSDESHPPGLQILPFEAPSSRRAQLSNPHLLPWSLRGLLEDRAVRATFGDEIQKLHDDFESWRPSTKTLKDVQYRLEPMRSIARPKPLPPPSPTPSNSKL